MRRRSAIPMIAFALAALVLARDRGLSAASTVPAARLTAISSTVDGHRSSLLIEASEPVAYQTSQPDASTLVVELRNVVPGDYANGFTAAPGSPIRAVAVEHGNSAAGEQVARVRVALTGTAQARVRSQRNLIFVEVDGQTAPVAAAVAPAASSAAAVEVVTPPTRDTRPSAIVRVRSTSGATPDPMSALTLNADGPQATVSQDPPVVVGAGARAQGQAGQPAAPAVDTTQSMTRSGGNKAFSGHPVSLDFQGADLRAVLRTFAEISGLNIVIDPSVQGSVDVALRDVPWDQALDIILRANKLGYFVDGTIVRVAPLTVLAEEEKQRRKLGEEQALSGEIKVLTHTLSYAKAEEIKPLLEKSALSQRGTVQFDPRTNTLDHLRPVGFARHRLQSDQRARHAAAAGRDRGAHHPDDERLRSHHRRAVGHQRPRERAARQHHAARVPEQRLPRRPRRAGAGTTRRQRCRPPSTWARPLRRPHSVSRSAR